MVICVSSCAPAPLRPPFVNAIHQVEHEVVLEWGWRIESGCDYELLPRDRFAPVAEAFGSVPIPMVHHQMLGSHRPGIDQG